MRKLFAITASLIVLSVLIGTYFRMVYAEQNVAQSSGDVQTPLAVAARKTSEQAVQATHTFVPEETLEPVFTEIPVAQVTPTVVVVEPTIDPNLLIGPKDAIQVNVMPDTISFHPVLKEIIKNLDYPDNSQVTGIVLEGDLSDVPVMKDLGAPCEPGHYSWLTGYDWYTHATHTAVDIACDNLHVGAPADGKVYAILWESEAWGYNSSGRNVITISTIPEGFSLPLRLNEEPTPMSGWLLFGHGHMAFEVPVVVGQNVKAGDYLGIMSETGNADGIHDHYYILWLRPDGSSEFINPNLLHAIGRR